MADDDDDDDGSGEVEGVEMAADHDGAGDDDGGGGDVVDKILPVDEAAKAAIGTLVFEVSIVSLVELGTLVAQLSFDTRLLFKVLLDARIEN